MPLVDFPACKEYSGAAFYTPSSVQGTTTSPESESKADVRTRRVRNAAGMLRSWSLCCIKWSGGNKTWASSHQYHGCTEYPAPGVSYEAWQCSLHEQFHLGLHIYSHQVAAFNPAASIILLNHQNFPACCRITMSAQTFASQLLSLDTNYIVVAFGTLSALVSTKSTSL